MASSRAPKVVDVGYFGGQEQENSEMHTIRAVFRDFASLPNKRGSYVDSPTLKCHGFEWLVMVYPRGDAQSSEATQHVSIYLHCKAATCANANVKVKAGFAIRIPSSGLADKRQWNKLLFKKGNTSLGWGDFCPRADILNPAKRFLVDGNLTVEVDIQVALDKPPVWIPSSTLSTDMLKMLESADAETADVSFQVGSDGAKESFFAHKNILKARCPDLAEITEGYDIDTVIPIEDVEPNIFRGLLRFVYGEEIPEKDFLATKARTLIHAANRFGITGIKLAAEAELASAGIDVENAADLILFSDGTKCAMLKEAAIEFFVSNSEAVMESEGYAKVEESPAICSELMKAAFGGSKKRAAPSGSDDRDYKRMRVATLRQKLDDKGLDVDGSREMLISRLEESD